MGYPSGEAGRNKSPQRTLRAATQFFTRAQGKRRFFALDEKPELLKHLDTIDQRAWEQYEAHLRRIPALDRAEFYRRLMEENKLRSVCALARLVGKQEEGIRPYLNLLKLPAPILQYLREHRDPATVRYFTEKTLRPLLKLGDPREAWRRFQEMIPEARREAGIWNPDGQEPTMETQ